jgi:signal transduction histidine kinase
MSKLLHSDDVDIVATALRNITERKLAEEEVHAKNQALEHQFRRQKALAEWSALMDRDQDIQELSGMILRYLSELLPAQAGVYFGLRSSRNSSWRVFVARNGRIEPETWASDKNRPLRQLADRVCTEKVTISCAPQELGIQKRAFAALPLDLSAGREGFIMVQDMNVDHYTDQDIDFLTTVATRLALGLENKKMVEDLVVAKDAAEAASKAKSQFLATLSHELRTPLNGIIGASQILEPVLDTADDQSTLQVIRNSSETMINMVDRILSFTQVEGGKLKFQCAEFSMDTLMSDVLDSLESLRSSRNLHLNVHRGTDMSRSWNSDYQSVKSIVLNLAENGLKFTNEGGVDIHLRTIDRQGRRFLHIEVHDTGCGFPADREEELFQPFTQAEGSHSRKFGGLGLGLAVCKALTHSLGGKIGTRPMNKGTLFWVEIPDGIHAAAPLPGDTEFFVSRSLDHDPDDPVGDVHHGPASSAAIPGAEKSSRRESTVKPNPARNESRTQGETQTPVVTAPSASRRTLVVEVSPVLRMGLMRHFDKSDVEADFCKDLNEMMDRLRQSIEQSVKYREVLISEKIQTEDLMKAMAGLQNEIGHGKGLPVFKRMIRSRGADGRSGSGLKLEKIEPRKAA